MALFWFSRANISPRPYLGFASDCAPDASAHNWTIFIDGALDEAAKAQDGLAPGTEQADGDEAGWNYVSFRDDNIRVGHKWVDVVQRYSIISTRGAANLGIGTLDEAMDAHDFRKAMSDAAGEAEAEAGRAAAGRGAPRRWPTWASRTEPESATTCWT